MFKKVTIYVYAVLMVALVAWQIVMVALTPPTSVGKPLTIDLKTGPLTLLVFPSHKPETQAVILFGSGDGGWSDFEESISRAFQDQGFEVVGIDSHAYARVDYDLDTLQSDFTHIARTVLAPFGDHPPTLILGGYSMGAAQAIAAAGGAHPPPGLIGLLVIDPLSRGRYGLRVSDQIDVLPNGPGTFAVDSFSHTLGSLRVVQWHADQDSIDSRRWLDSLTAPHKTYTFPNTGHYYTTARDEFLRRLLESARWIVDPNTSATLTEKQK